MITDPKIPSYDNNSVANKITSAVAWISILVALLTLYIVYDAWNTTYGFWLYVAIGVWAVGPPVWFWSEYFFVYRKWGKDGTLELFKYGQQVAGAIWAGMLAGLIALASSDIILK